MKQLKTIKRELDKLLDDRMAELGITNWMGVIGRHGEVWPEPLCPLINPLCPDDLCWLPADHPGTAEHVHVLGTTAWTYMCKVSKIMTLAPVGTPRDELMHLGWAEAERRGWND